MRFDNITPYASSKGVPQALAGCLNIEFKASGFTFQRGYFRFL